MPPLPLRCGVLAALAVCVLPVARPQGAPTPAPSTAARERAALSWNGRYTGDQIALELNAPKAGAVSGTLTVDGQSFPLIALVVDAKLVGTVQMAGDATSFQATLDGETLRCVIGGANIPLKRAGVSSPAAAAPAARPPAATSAPATATAPAEAGQLVQLSGGGAFRIPAGWTHREEAEGVMLLPPGVRFDPNRTDNPEVYLFATRDDYDPAEEAKVVRDLSAAVAQGGGSGGQRRAAKFGARDGVVYQWEFRDPNSGRAMGFNIFLAAEGTRAMVIIAMGEGSRLRASDTAVRQILASVTFAPAAAAQPSVARGVPSQGQSGASAGRPAPTAGDASALADATPLAQRWLAKLRGMMVRQFWASQGMSSDKRHFLNADGTYAFRSSSMVSVDVSGASGLSTGRDSSTGRWKIREISGRAYLEVSYNDGNVRRMPITEDNRNWYLNGEKAFAVNPE